MERPIKGGYILISLGLIALSTSYSGSIDYDKISRTKKHIVLTGIKVGDTVMPDICVKPVYGNGTITFEDVYGFDVVVSSNNSVSVSEHVVPSGSTKWYRHNISIDTDEEGNKNINITVLSTSSTAYTDIPDLRNGNIVFIQGWFTDYQDNSYDILLLNQDHGTSNFLACNTATIDVSQVPIVSPFTNFVDTVTEL